MEHVDNARVISPNPPEHIEHCAGMPGTNNFLHNFLAITAVGFNMGSSSGV